MRERDDNGKLIRDKDGNAKLVMSEGEPINPGIVAIAKARYLKAKRATKKPPPEKS